MGKDSAIEWTDHTWNIGWGCTYKSPGCLHCYAERLATRFGYDVWGKDRPRRILSDDNWRKPLAWNAEAEHLGVRRRVFCGSMMDWADPDWRNYLPRLWQLWIDTPNLDWLMLTKNVYRLQRSLPEDWLASWNNLYSNVWLGVSAENQEWADKRIPRLLEIPSVVNFVSAEPLLGQVDLLSAAWGLGKPLTSPLYGINWVICGGESGPEARPMHPDWARSLRDQCATAGLPFFFKQWGTWLHESNANDSWKPDSPTLLRISSIPEKHPDRFHRWSDGSVSKRVGKQYAGRLIDYQEHDEFPSLVRAGG